MRKYVPIKARPLAALFTRTPSLVSWVSEHKHDDAEFLIRTVEFNLGNKKCTTRDKTIVGLWEAAIASVQHTETKGTPATAYTRSTDGKMEPVWRSFLRHDGSVACGAFGVTEKGVAKAARAQQAREEARRRGEDVTPAPRVFTKADKRRAVESFFAPRAATEPEAQQGQSKNDKQTREEKARLIADLLKPRLV